MSMFFYKKKKEDSIIQINSQRPDFCLVRWGASEIPVLDLILLYTITHQLCQIHELRWTRRCCNFAAGFCKNMKTRVVSLHLETDPPVICANLLSNVSVYHFYATVRTELQTLKRASKPLLTITITTT